MEKWVSKMDVRKSIDDSNKISRFKFVSKLISKKDTLLDIGCGQGLSSIFSDYCKYVYGVDLLSDF